MQATVWKTGVRRLEAQVWLEGAYARHLVELLRGAGVGIPAYEDLLRRWRASWRRKMPRAAARAEMAGKQPSRRVPAQLEAVLDWYFEALNDPRIASLLGRLDSGSCARCGAKIGEVHERECPWHGRVHIGAIRARSSDLESALRRGAAISQAMKQLRPAERDAIRVAWTFRRQFQWWTNAALNARRGNSVLPGYAAVFASPKEIRELASFYRMEWHRAKRKTACREGLRRLEVGLGRGEVW